MSKAEASEIMALVEAIRPLMAGHKAEVQGAALADLLALWVAGHMCRAPSADEWTMRETLLKLHLDGVRKLIPLNVDMLRDQLESIKGQIQ